MLLPMRHPRRISSWKTLLWLGLGLLVQVLLWHGNSSFGVLHVNELLTTSTCQGHSFLKVLQLLTLLNIIKAPSHGYVRTVHRTDTVSRRSLHGALTLLMPLNLSGSLMNCPHSRIHFLESI